MKSGRVPEKPTPEFFSVFVSPGFFSKTEVNVFHRNSEKWSAVPGSLGAQNQPEAKAKMASGE